MTTFEIIMAVLAFITLVVFIIDVMTKK